jgi:hypothetical protein
MKNEYKIIQQYNIQVILKYINITYLLVHIFYWLILLINSTTESNSCSFLSGHVLYHGIING